MAANINRVIITGNLTKDPELRHTQGGTAVTTLRVAVNSSRKDNQTGQWVDKPNYFDVTVWGRQAEIASQYLAKGRSVAVDGRLDWREWQDQAGNKRQSVEIIADSIQFLGGPREDGGMGGGQQTYNNGGQQGGGYPNQQGNQGGGYPGGQEGDRFTPPSDLPSHDTSDFNPAPASVGSAADDDIPF